MKYVGLTDDPEKSKEEHGNPPDWRQRCFASETEARLWLRKWILKPGYTGSFGGTGWRYGYSYTMTKKRKK